MPSNARQCHSALPAFFDCNSGQLPGRSACPGARDALVDEARSISYLGVDVAGLDDPSKAPWSPAGERARAAERFVHLDDISQVNRSDRGGSHAGLDDLSQVDQVRSRRERPRWFLLTRSCQLAPRSTVDTLHAHAGLDKPSKAPWWQPGERSGLRSGLSTSTISARSTVLTAVVPMPASTSHRKHRGGHLGSGPGCGAVWPPRRSQPGQRPPGRSLPR